MEATMSVLTQPAARPARRIPPPAGDKEVLKANVFERMQSGNTQLLPLFPYCGEGDLVPCGAILRGEPGADWGHFFHWNTVDEVVTVFGGSGGLLHTGQVFATQKLHGVNSFLKDPNDASSFLVLTITQRQSVAEPQQEAVILRCGQCAEQLVRFDYDAPPLPPADRRDPDPDAHPPFTTIVKSWEAVAGYNADETKRQCPKCGAANPPFPLARWGWGQYAAQSQTVNAARRALDAAAREHLAAE
jgi:hypothetical protein